jgi:hypothetical protein
MNVFREKSLPLLEQVVQSLKNHFERSSTGCCPLVSGGGNILETFLYFTVIGDKEKLVSLLF